LFISDGVWSSACCGDAVAAVTEQGLPDVPEPAESEVERMIGRPRMHRLRRRASPGELDRALEWLAEDLRRKAPSEADEAIYQRAEAQLAKLLERDPKLATALLELAPSSRAPDRRDIYPLAEFAAAVAHPSVARVLRTMALTPSARGPVGDLSGAAASLVLMSLRGGASIARGSFEELRNSPAASWALGQPRLDVGDKQAYKQLITITGR
jgi:hypothetical protein